MSELLRRAERRTVDLVEHQTDAMFFRAGRELGKIPLSGIGIGPENLRTLLHVAAVHRVLRQELDGADCSDIAEKCFTIAVKQSFS